MLNELSFFCLVLTLAAFRIGQLCQTKWKLPLFNPILVAAILTGAFLMLTGMGTGAYATSLDKISWLMAPATISLAIPMYEQFQVLRRHLKAVFVAVAAGSLVSLAFLAVGGVAFGVGKPLVLSLLPKSVTTAIGVPLSQMSGGIPSVTTVAIVATGILANMAGPWLCKVFRITDPIAQGVALGTSGHVIGTAKANEMSALTGAVSSLSLVVAGVLTAVLMPLLVQLI